MSWGTRRRNFIVFIFALIVIIPTTIVAWNLYYTPPNCFDKIQNGDERGIDCGGSCALICQSSVIQPIIVWKRHFEVAPGTYNVIAYVENPNSDAGVYEAPYEFKLYNNENILIQQREGVVKLRPKEILPIVENTLFTDQSRAYRTTFEFTKELVFEKMPEYKPVIVIKDEEVSELDSTPKIEASLLNTDTYPVSDIEVVVIVYDENNNTIASSSTYVERIQKDTSIPVVFTWPQPFSGELSRIEIIPIYEHQTE